MNRADLLRSFSMCMSHCRRLLADVPHDQFAVQPIPGMNHAAWILGHLIYSFESIEGELGIRPWLPLRWPALFGTGSDPTQVNPDYPCAAYLAAALEDAQRRLVDALNEMPDDGLDRPLPDENHRHIFPTVGSAVLHILTVHAATHVGQLSAWRRAMGLPPVADPL